VSDFGIGHLWLHSATLSKNIMLASLQSIFTAESRTVRQIAHSTGSKRETQLISLTNNLSSNYRDKFSSGRTNRRIGPASITAKLFPCTAIFPCAVNPSRGTAVRYYGWYSSPHRGNGSITEPVQNSISDYFCVRWKTVKKLLFINIHCCFY